MPFGLGVGEVLVILAIMLLVFGAKRLPELGGALGKGIREFKSSVRDIETEMKRPADDPRRELQRPAASRADAGSDATRQPEAEEVRPFGRPEREETRP